jgi:hypothetical protein
MQIDLEEMGLLAPMGKFLDLSFLGLNEQDKKKLSNPIAFDEFLTENRIKTFGYIGDSVVSYSEDAGDKGQGLAKLWQLYLTYLWSHSYWEPNLGHVDIEETNVDMPSDVFKRVWKATRDAYITYLKDGEDAMFFSGQRSENQERFIFDNMDFSLFIGPVTSPCEKRGVDETFWRLVIAYLD